MHGKTVVEQVLSFWFEELSPARWFNGGRELDEQIGSRFSTVLRQAAAGELEHWRTSAMGRLAEIIVLDQFSRNLYRDTAQAFAQDGMALILSQEAVRAGALNGMDNAQQCSFLLMPYMHSESRYIHQLAVPLFQRHASEDSYRFELLHKGIIDRFGRYPHRNAALNRESTAEELEFLQQPGSSF